jgi:prepilin-type N-terminal cleavage/methylation domain-containing protein
MKVRGGFTLMEVVVGLAVASLALAAGFGALSLVGDRGRHADNAAAEVLHGAAQRAQLQELLAGARLRHAGERFQGLSAELLGLASDELYLPTTGRTVLDEPVSLARLYIDTDPTTPVHGLVAEVIARAGDEPVYQELVPDAGRLILRYGVVDPLGQVAWESSWTANRLPQAIELTLEPAPGRSLPPLLAYPLRVRLETVP